MIRFYLRASDDRWELVRQDNASGDWLDISTIGSYDSFEAGVAMAEIHSPLMYDETMDVPEDWRASDEELQERVERDETLG
jgi:hypothetical protein